jgi:hypothetical protein
MAVLRADLVLQFGKYVTCDRIATTSGTMSLGAWRMAAEMRLMGVA